MLMNRSRIAIGKELKPSIRGLISSQSVSSVSKVNKCYSDY